MVGLEHEISQIAHLAALLGLFLLLPPFFLVFFRVFVGPAIKLGTTSISTLDISWQNINILLILPDLASIIFATIYSGSLFNKIYLIHSTILSVFLKVSKIRGTTRIIRL